MSNPNNDIKIKVIIGLGNPGPKYYFTRHNIGFRILDELCNKYSCQWKSTNNMELSEIVIGENKILLIKPLTFMNTSGEVVPFLKKKNIESKNVLVLHDELELPFGSIKLKFSGSSKGHNGLKSIISFFGSDFYRLRFGIDRPDNREMVPNYVLSKFNQEEEDKIQNLILSSINEIEKILS